MAAINSSDIPDVPVAELVAEASETRVLDASEEEVLVGRHSSGQDQALEALIRSHLRIAVDEAIRNRGIGTRQERLVRAASRALVEAAPKYEPSTDGPFREYARRTVRRAIRQTLAS